MAENQFTKAQQEGLQPGDEGYPEGANQFTTGKRTEHPEEVRQKIRVGNIIARLEKIIAESDQENNVIAASKVLIDKTLPSLSSVDQRVTDNSDSASQEELEAKLRALVSKANPALLSRILGERAKDLAHLGIKAEVGNDSDNSTSKAA